MPSSLGIFNQQLVKGIPVFVSIPSHRRRSVQCSVCVLQPASSHLPPAYIAAASSEHCCHSRHYFIPYKLTLLPSHRLLLLLLPHHCLLLLPLPHHRLLLLLLLLCR